MGHRAPLQAGSMSGKDTGSCYIRLEGSHRIKPDTECCIKNLAEKAQEKAFSGSRREARPRYDCGRQKNTCYKGLMWRT